MSIGNSFTSRSYYLVPAHGLRSDHRSGQRQNKLLQFAQRIKFDYNHWHFAIPIHFMNIIFSFVIDILK